MWEGTVPLAALAFVSTPGRGHEQPHALNLLYKKIPNSLKAMEVRRKQRLKSSENLIRAWHSR